jgi:hypothetical protein
MNLFQTCKQHSEKNQGSVLLQQKLTLEFTALSLVTQDIPSYAA